MTLLRNTAIGPTVLFVAVFTYGCADSSSVSISGDTGPATDVGNEVGSTVDTVSLDTISDEDARRYGLERFLDDRGSPPDAGLIVSESVQAPLPSASFGSSDTYWGGLWESRFYSVIGGAEGTQGDPEQGMVFVSVYDPKTWTPVGSALLRTRNHLGPALIEWADAGVVTIGYRVSDAKETISLAEVAIWPDDESMFQNIARL